MKITEEYDDKKVEVIDITAANYIGNFTIRITFSDGTSKLLVFRRFLENSVHPSIKKYLDEANFINFSIVDGNLNWNDYDLIFPIEDLYKGEIS